MAYNHWYDPNFYIQTFDKAGPQSPGTIFPLSRKQFLSVVTKKNLHYKLFNRFLELQHSKWLHKSLSEIAEEVTLFFKAKKIENPEFILMLWDKENEVFYSCNFGLPPLQIRTKQSQNIELIQVNNYAQSQSKLLIDAINIDTIDLIFASDSWIAYSFFKKDYLDISFKKDLLMLFKYYGIPEEFEAVDQFVLFGSQTDSDVKIAHMKSLDGTLSDISAYETEFEHIVSRFFDDTSRNGSAAIVFNELVMNSYEYGILGIDPEEKQKVMNEGNYFKWIESFEKGKKGTIDISIDIYRSNTLRVTIDDHGNGFDYTLIDQYITDEFDYRGRGLGMIGHMIDGLFYTNKGSQVIFFLRYDTPVWSEYSKECQLYFKSLRLLAITNRYHKKLEKSFEHKIEQIYCVRDDANPLQIAREKRPTFLYIDINDLQQALTLSQEVKSILGDIPTIISSQKFDQILFLQAIEKNIDQILPSMTASTLISDAMLQSLQHRYYLEGEDCFLNDAEKEDIRAQNQYYKEQQSKAFEKQKLVIHDDSDQFKWLQQKLLYRPMEILSGDIYSIFKVNDDCFISYIIDSMGKGIAASVTAILSAAFINRAVILSRDFQDFGLARVVNDFVGFVRPNLLEDEVLSCSFVYVDRKTQQLQHVSFGMYPILLKDVLQKKFEVLKSPHPPLMNFEMPYTIADVALPKKFELLIYSDGLCEMEGFSIGALVEMFSKSHHYDDFNAKLEQQLDLQEQTDDITMLYVSS